MARTGRRTRGRHCWLRWAPLPDDHPPVPHVGYAIGRTVGNAVVRNRIRRRLRAILAEQTDVPPGLYLFGVYDASTADIAFRSLRDDVARVLERGVLERGLLDRGPLDRGVTEA